MSRAKISYIEMCSGSIPKNVLRFALPIIAGNFAQILFNATDMVVVGQFVGEKALAAVGANTSLVFLIFNLFVGISIGANVVTARYYGAGDWKRVSESVHCSMAIAVLSGILIMIVSIAIARASLNLLDTPADILDDAVTYLKVYACSFPFMMVFNFTRAILNAEGDTKYPLYCLLLSGATNVVLNLAFVILFGLGVFGVALATVFSNFLSAAMMVVHLCNKTTVIKLHIRKIHITKKEGVEIIKVGLPAGIQGVAFSVSNVIMQDAVNSFGSVVVAGNTAVINIEGFLYQAMYGFYQASSTFVSQNFGAGKYDRIKKILYFCLFAAFTSGFGVAIISIIFRNQIIGIYSGEADVVAAGAIRILVVFPLYCLCGLNDVISGAMRGIGFPTIPLIISLIGACVFRVVWILTLFSKFHTLEVLYLSYPVSWVLTCLAHLIAFRICYKKVMSRRC